MRKVHIIVGITLVLLLIVGGVVFASLRKKDKPEENSQPTKPVEQVNLIPLEERPYVSIEPNQKGRNLVFTLHDVKKPAQKAELEVEYQSGTQLQGAFLSFKLANLPDSQDMLLGSCSAGGKCSYHEEVTGGNILLRFLGDEKYVLKNDWSFFENTQKETSMVSRDSKFRLEGTGLASVTHGVILQSPGLPKNVEQKLLSAPYSVGLISEPKGKVTVHIRLNEDLPTAKILAWDGEAWLTLTTTVEEKVATAESPLYQAYIAVE